MSTEELHPGRVDEARSAILRRFHELDTPPNGIAKFSLFFEKKAQYRGGYLDVALQQLGTEGCVEPAMTGVLRLTQQGYEAAQNAEM